MDKSEPSTYVNEPVRMMHPTLRKIIVPAGSLAEYDQHGRLVWYGPDEDEEIMIG